jgi:integrase
MPRKNGSRNRGYFFVRRRGWFAKIAGQYRPLTDTAGNRLRVKETTKTVLEDALHRIRNERPPAATTVWELSQFYLAELERSGSASTFEKRRAYLYDFCTGLSRVKKRIHDGFSDKPAEKITQLQVIDWLNRHPGWGKGTRRLAIQCLKRAYNFGVSAMLISVNPLRGMKVPKPGARITCISPEQEAALLSVAPKQLAIAIKILIRTGMRPSEFAKLTANHVHDLGDRLELKFSAEEIKTRKARIVRVADPEIIGLIRGRDRFTGKLGQKWKVKSLSRAFARAKAKCTIAFDKDCCLYSCRHTFAKRVLTGYWTGKPITIEILSLLMGNTPEVCRANYLQWSDAYTAPLWDAVG